MRHVDMRKLPAAAQEERRRQVIGLRQAGMTYEAIAAQAGLSPTGVFDICKRYAERGAAGLKTGPRGPKPGYGRFLDAEQEAEARDLIRRHTPDGPHLFYLPGYSPELNPDEGINGDLKQAVTRQAPARSKAQLN